MKQTTAPRLEAQQKIIFTRMIRVIESIHYILIVRNITEFDTRRTITDKASRLKKKSSCNNGSHTSTNSSAIDWLSSTGSKGGSGGVVRTVHGGLGKRCDSGERNDGSELHCWKFNR